MDDQKLSDILGGIKFSDEDLREKLRLELLEEAKSFDKNPNRHVFNQLKETNPELAAIAMNETSGGINLNHPVDKKSGTQAGGLFALMPRTVSDIMGRDQELQTRYPDLSNLSKDWKTNHVAITDLIEKNPQVAQKLAEKHYNRAKSRFKGDLDRTANSWFNGITGTLKMTPEQVKNHDYTKKFRKAYDSINKSKTMLASED
jgi:hypothetical protein